MVQWIKVHAIWCDSLSSILRAQEKKKKKHTIECMERLFMGWRPASLALAPRFSSLHLKISNSACIWP